MNIFEASYGVGVVVGATSGCLLGLSWSGWVGGVIGVLLGGVVGGLTMPLVAFSFFVVAITFQEGPSGLRKLFSAMRKKDTDDTDSGADDTVVKKSD